MMTSIRKGIFTLTVLLVFLSYQRLYLLILPYYDYINDDLVNDIEDPTTKHTRILAASEKKKKEDIMIRPQLQEQEHEQQQEQEQEAPNKCQVKHNFFPRELFQNISNSSTFCHPTVSLVVMKKKFIDVRGFVAKINR